MAVVIYKINECCGNMESKSIDPMQTELCTVDGWQLTKELAIAFHDTKYIDPIEHTVYCLWNTLKIEIKKNKNLHKEIEELEEKIDSAYVSYGSSEREI